MSAKPAKQKPIETAPAAANGAASNGANEAHEMLHALNAAFHPGDQVLPHEQLSLPDALW